MTTEIMTRWLCTEKAELTHWEKGFAYRVKFQAAKSEPFGKATPSGNSEMLIVPKEAADAFVPGLYYMARFYEDPDQKTPQY